MPVEGTLGPQLPLALRAPADQRLERYLRAPSGLLEQLQSLASGDSGGALYLQGSAATGKTHLLLGSCALAAALDRQAAYLPLANVRGRLRAASEGLDAEAVQSVKANVQAIQGLLPKVSASQTYAGIAMQCGDGSSELIFLDNNNAIEQSFGGGETYYEHYRK